MKKRYYKTIFFISSIILVGTIFIYLTIGTDALSFSRIFAVLIGSGEPLENFILFDLRLPRLLIVLFAGMALVISGGLLQTLLKNDLADPGIIGINSGAGVGIAVFFLFTPFKLIDFGYALPLAGGIGALVTAFIILLLAKNSSRAILLNGIGFSFALSGLMVVLMSSANREKVDFIARWLAGSIWGIEWLFVWVMLISLIIFVPFIIIYSHKLDVLTLDDNTIINLGIRAEKWRIIFVITAVLLAAVTVSITGMVAFLGLIGPHIARSLVGPKHRLFIPLAMIIGAWLFVVADTISMRIQIPAGTLLAIIGCPYFIYLLFKKV